MENQYKALFDKRRDAVVQYLDLCIGYMENQNDAENVRPLEMQRENVQKDLFSIVVVGEFSAGKSTFLNALMHRRILPSFTSETTATINFLRHKDQAPEEVAGRVYYADGHTRDLPSLDLDVIEQVVSTRGDDVADKIDHGDLFLESDFLKDGVMMVDSPGLNGMLSKHRQMTEKQIKSSHACIFMFRADQPGSKTEFEFLHELKEQSKNILFVLNRIDRIHSYEKQSVEDVVQSIRSTYHNQFPEETSLPKIWPVSAYYALMARDEKESTKLNNNTPLTEEEREEKERQSRFADFEARLWKYLTQGERAHDQLCEPVTAALDMLQAEKEKLRTTIKLIQENNDGNELEKQKEQLESSLAELRKNRRVSPEIARRVHDVVRTLQDRAVQQVEAIQNKLNAGLEDLDQPSEITEAASHLPMKLQHQFEHMAGDLESQLHDNLLSIVSEEYEEYLSDLEDKISGLSSGLSFSFQKKKFEISNISIGVDLEKFEQQCNDLRAQIKELEDKRDQSQLDAIQARNIETQRQEKKEELKELQQNRRFIQESFSIPDVSYHTEEEDASFWRGGIFGFVANVFCGKKHATRAVTVSDTSSRDQALRQREELLSNLKQDSEVIRQELAALPTLNKSSAVLKQEEARADASISRLEEKLTQYEQQHLDELASKSKKACKRLYREIRDEVESISDEALSEIRKYISQQENQYLGAVRDLLNVSLDQEIASAQKRLDLVLSTLQKNRENQEQVLSNANTSLETAQNLINQGTELRIQLENDLSDHIEEEKL